MNYTLKSGAVFARFLAGALILLTNNASERAMCGIPLGRKSRLFTGSDRDGQRAAVMNSLIVTAKMSTADPQAWRTHLLANIAQHPANQLGALLPQNWQPQKEPA